MLSYYRTMKRLPDARAVHVQSHVDRNVQVEANIRFLRYRDFLVKKRNINVVMYGLRRRGMHAWESRLRERFYDAEGFRAQSHLLPANVSLASASWLQTLESMTEN